MSEQSQALSGNRKGTRSLFYVCARLATGLCKRGMYEDLLREVFIRPR